MVAIAMVGRMAESVSIAPSQLGGVISILILGALPVSTMGERDCGSQPLNMLPKMHTHEELTVCSATQRFFCHCTLCFVVTGGAAVNLYPTELVSIMVYVRVRIKQGLELGLGLRLGIGFALGPS